MDHKKEFELDYYRYCGKQKTTIEGILRILKSHELRYIYYGRKVKENKYSIFNKYFKYRMWLIRKKYGLEISLNNISGGLLLIHPYNITINSKVTIGKYATIFKGATIGSIRSGRNSGVPKIGDRVTICTNAFVCGGITIGDNVLIAANSYVNFDVPNNSIVIGNPGIIKTKSNPSKDYLKNIMDL